MAKSEIKCAALGRVKELLGGETFPKCESASLRLEKFVRIGGDTKKEEIDAVVSKTPQKVPPFTPKGAICFSAKLGSRLIVDQAGGVLENAGLCLHPHFNAPCIPGSAVKGVARHAAWEAWNAETDMTRKNELAEELAQIFGFPTNDRKLDEHLKSLGWKDARSGCVCFMPAHPETTAKLVTDILTPHHGNDWTNPIPSAFPAVESGTKMCFAVVPRKDVTLAEKASAWLKKAIVDNGVGAKTNAGYGRFIVEGEMPQYDAVVNLHFASPAFLRGAEDEGRLRIATLRGMMRWWWRWLYRSVLSENDLQTLEQGIWGGCSGTASASCISLGFVSENVMASMPFDKVARTPNNRQKQLRTTGLAYLSYGMDEKIHGETKRRRVLDVHPSNKWMLGVMVNERGGRLSKEQLLTHAKLALWALCNFGGVGSKARKGFGSLCCDVEYPDFDAVFGAMGASLAGSGVEMTEDDVTSPYAMTTSMMDKVKTKSRSSWFVLDRIGYALQCVAADYKHKEEKAVLGLPRKIHGPMRDPIGHQRAPGHFHRPPLNLTADKPFVRDRFASPLAIHLKDSSDGIEVNLTAFPSDYARDVATSEGILGECIEEIKAVLSEI